jgi:hypothetical protein
MRAYQIFRSVRRLLNDRIIFSDKPVRRAAVELRRDEPFRLAALDTPGRQLAALVSAALSNHDSGKMHGTRAILAVALRCARCSTCAHTGGNVPQPGAMGLLPSLARSRREPENLVHRVYAHAAHHAQRHGSTSDDVQSRVRRSSIESALPFSRRRRWWWWWWWCGNWIRFQALILSLLRSSAE